MRVGFIGLGMMGKGMAANLQKAGHELVVHDLSRAAAEPFLAKGALWANSPKQVAEQTEVVFTSLPVPADVEQVALGANGLIEGMRPDTAFFDMSTNSVATVRKIHAAFAEKNLYMLDAPVSGGPSGAASGKMAIWVGGDEQQFNRHKLVLDAMGDQAAYIGPIGAGSIAKLVHNCTSAVLGAALAEVFTMGVKAGVDPVDLWAAVRQGATGGCAPSTGSATSSCRANTTRPISRCACCTKMSGSQSVSGARSACRCAWRTWSMRN